MARTVRTVSWGRADRERRIRRLTGPLHAPETNATRNATATVAADDQAITPTDTTDAAARVPTGRALVSGVRPVSLATEGTMLRAHGALGGTAWELADTACCDDQRIRRMCTDCTSPNSAK